MILLQQALTDLHFPTFALDPSRWEGPIVAEFGTSYTPDEGSVATAVKLHYMDRLEEPNCGALVSNMALKQLAPVVHRIDAHIANFVARFESFVPSSAERFPPSDFVAHESLLVELLDEGYPCQVDRHRTLPLKVSEIVVNRTVLCVATWNSSFITVIRQLSLLDEEIAETIDQRGGSGLSGKPARTEPSVHSTGQPLGLERDGSDSLAFAPTKRSRPHA